VYSAIVFVLRIAHGNVQKECYNNKKERGQIHS
jgi:hypothetical protein